MNRENLRDHCNHKNKKIDKDNAKVTPAPPTIMVVETASKASAEANIIQLNIKR